MMFKFLNPSLIFHFDMCFIVSVIYVLSPNCDFVFLYTGFSTSN